MNTPNGRQAMNEKYSSRELIGILKFLDSYIEIEMNSTSIYRDLAYTAKHETPRAMFGWLFNIESSRLRLLLERKRKMLIEYPELIDSSLYEPRVDTGLTKMGSANHPLLKGGCLDILRYAIEAEARAKQFFQRKASAATDPMQRMLYSSAAIEQADQVEYLGSQRELLLQQQVNHGARKVGEAVA